MKKPVRYRDVLAMLKAMARDERISSDGLRAVLAGNIGEGPETYTQADIKRARELATELGCELGADLEPSDPGTSFDTPERYQEEIRRLHAALRVAREQVTAFERARVIAQEKSNKRTDARRAQMDAAGVKSIDEAFALLKALKDALEEYGSHDIDKCGFIDDGDGGRTFVDTCTCGLDGILSRCIAAEPATAVVTLP